MLVGETEKDRETESEKSPPGGMATLQSLLLHSPLGILSTHAHVPGVSFEPPGPGLKSQSTTWESSDIAIMLTAGPMVAANFGLEYISITHIKNVFCGTSS